MRHIDIDTRIEIARQILILHHKYPREDKEKQKKKLKMLTYNFKQLLQTKARQERIDEVCDDYCSTSENCSPSPTNNPTGGICIRDILKKKITGSRKRNNHSRKKEGYVESCLGKHETKGW